MPSRFWKQFSNFRSARGWRLPRLTAPALAALAMIGAVIVGIRLGNGAIGDINPVHYRGAAVHPRDRGAAVTEGQQRQREPTYAALYGWDEGRAARSEAVSEAAEIHGFDEAAMERELEAPARLAPSDVRVAIHRGEDGIDRYRVEMDDDFEEEQALDAKRRERMRAFLAEHGSAIHDSDF